MSRFIIGTGTTTTTTTSSTTTPFPMAVIIGIAAGGAAIAFLVVVICCVIVVLIVRARASKKVANTVTLSPTIKTQIVPANKTLCSNYNWLASQLLPSLSSLKAGKKQEYKHC